MSKREVSPSEGACDADVNSKKQRINKEHHTNEAVVSFNDINNDCLIHILSYLLTDDMNSFAVCSRECRKVRSAECLDQSRTATIVWTQTTSPFSFLRIMTANQHVFTGNRKDLRIVGNVVQPIMPIMAGLPTRNSGLRLNQVTSLDCSFSNSSIERRNVGIYCDPVLAILGPVLSNLRVIDLTNVISDVGRAVGYFSQNCPSLTKIKWNKCPFPMLCGHEFRDCNSLTHLTLDDTTFLESIFTGRQQVLQSYAADPSLYLFMKCKHLTTLSIKGTRLGNFGPLSQEMLMKMARQHPTLRWLRSDLTVENIAILKKERPEVTFI